MAATEHTSSAVPSSYWFANQPYFLLSLTAGDRLPRRATASVHLVGYAMVLTGVFITARV